MALIGQGAQGVGIDYSPVSQSAWNLSRANSSAISSAIGTVGDIIKDRRDKKDTIKTSKELAKAMAVLYPESAQALEPVIAQLDDEETPLSQRAALGSQIGEFINMGVQKSRDNALMNLERQRIGLDERRVAIAEAMPQAEAAAAQSQALSENDLAMDKAIAKGIATADAAKMAGVDLPTDTTSLLNKYLEEGNGAGALAAAEAQAAAIDKFIAPQGGKKLAQIGVDSGTLDVFVDPTGAITDLQGNPLNTAAIGEGVLPPRPSDEAGVVPMQGAPERRIPAMPPNMGFRPAAGAQTPAQARKEELEIAKLEADAAAAEKKAIADAAATNANIDKLQKVADKYTDVDPATGMRVPKAKLRDVTGPFATAGKFVDKYFDAEEFAAKAELQRFVEADLLEATKDLKPVSEDEMKLLMSRRPLIDSPSEAWAQYMDEVLSFIASKSGPSAAGNAGATATDGLTPTQRATLNINEQKKRLQGK